MPARGLGIFLKFFCIKRYTQGTRHVLRATSSERTRKSAAARSTRCGLDVARHSVNVMVLMERMVMFVECQIVWLVAANAKRIGAGFPLLAMRES